jgi:hypothetical protein
LFKQEDELPIEEPSALNDDAKNISRIGQLQDNIWIVRLRRVFQAAASERPIQWRSIWGELPPSPTECHRGCWRPCPDPSAERRKLRQQTFTAANG